MRRSVRWIGGLVATAWLAFSLVPTASALDIEGDLYWRSAAQVTGVLDVNADTSSYLLQHVPAGAAAQEYAWTMTAEKLSVFSSTRQEASATDHLVARRNADSEWTNETFEFAGATVQVKLTPAHGHGATALFYAQPDGAAVTIAPQGGTPAHVRSVRLAEDLMSVPDSGRKGSTGHSYVYGAPKGQLLEVTGRFDAQMMGDVDAAFFGWELDVSASHDAAQTFETGIRSERDSTTGFSSGTVLQYVRVHAEGAKLVVPPMRENVPIYTPLLRYVGHGEYPAGAYFGRNMELAPQGRPSMVLDGEIWMSSVEGEYDQNYVHAWGETDWKAPAPLLSLPAVALPSAAPVFIALAGLSLASHLAPELVRGLRAGLFLAYARLRDQEPNANPTRERIYQAIVAEPGLNLSRIVDRLDIGWGTAAYHVQILKRQTRVRELRFLNRVCFFPAENPDETRQLQTVLLRQPNYREVMTVVEAQPGLSQREVAGRTGHARQYISRLVAKMERAGLLRTEPSRLGRRYFPVPPRGVEVDAKSPLPTNDVVPPASAPPVPTGFQAPAGPY